MRAGPKPTRTIGFYLVALVMLAMIPLMIIAGVLIWRQSVLQQQVFDRTLLQAAQALSGAVDRQLHADRVMLETLAQSPLIDSGELAAFQALCTRVIVQRQGLFISLFDAEGRQIFNTLRPPGSTLPTPFAHAPADDPDKPPVGDATALRRVLQTGMPANSDLTYGLVAGRLLFTMNVPVNRDGRIRYILNAAFEPEVMTRLLHESAQYRGVPAVILDGRGFIVGRSKDAEKFVGKRAAPTLLEQLKGGDTGVTSGQTLQGVPLRYAYARSPSTGWTASMGIDQTEMERLARPGWLIGGALALGGLLVGALLALSIGARLTRSIVALATAASRNEPPRTQGLRTREIDLLERAVTTAAQARETQARKEEAEAASRAKDRYIAMLSHELRNPLAALNNALHLARIQVEKQPAEASESFAVMQRQIAQLTRMVNDLLDVSRNALGKVSLQAARVDLREVVSQAIEAVRPAIERKRLRLSRQVAGSAHDVQGDGARLVQVFSNLLDNAAKFTPEGGEIVVRIERRGTEAVVSVTDSGSGISAEFLPQMFEPFTQADTGLGRDAGGLGLGLALARQIVQAHGGEIAAASGGANQGTVLTVRLPAV